MQLRQLKLSAACAACLIPTGCLATVAWGQDQGDDNRPRTEVTPGEDRADVPDSERSERQQETPRETPRDLEGDEGGRQDDRGAERGEERGEERGDAEQDRDRADAQPAGLGVTTVEEPGQGVRVNRVFRGSPAADAGIRVNDRIVEAGGRQIVTPRQLATVVRRQEPGSDFPLRVWRNGQARSLVARLEARRQALDLPADSSSGQRQERAFRAYDPPRGLDDVSAHCQHLEQEIQRLSEEIRQLRAMLGSDPDKVETGGALRRTDATGDAEDRRAPRDEAPGDARNDGTVPPPPEQPAPEDR